MEVLPYVLTGVGTIMQMSAASDQGDAAWEAAKMRADQERRQAELDAAMKEREAGEERATAQRAAEEARRAARLKASRAMAVAAASGASASDVDIINAIGSIEGEGAYNADVELFKGEDSARYKEWLAKTSRVQGENAARMTLYEGKAAKSAARSSAVGSLVSGASSMYNIYSSNNPSSAEPETATAPGYDYGSSTVESRDWWK